MESQPGEQAQHATKLIKAKDVDWDYVNRELRHHGLPPVEFMHEENLKGKILLTTESSDHLLKTLASLLRDCDRRQDLIRDLITSNGALRSELKEQTNTTDKYENLSRDLRVMLNASQDKVQELENSLLNFSNSSNHEDEIARRSKSALESKCVQLGHLCSTQEKEIKCLQDKVKKIREENENRNTHNQKIFTDLKKSSRLINNEVILGLIDSYERKLHNLRRKLNYAKELKMQAEDTLDIAEEDIPDYKTIIQTYEKEQKILDKKLKTCEKEKEVLELDLQSRPDMETYKGALHKIKKLERTLKAHKMNEQSSKPPAWVNQFQGQLYSDELSYDQCEVLVMAVQEELKVENHAEIIKELKSLVLLKERAYQLEKILNEIVKHLFSDDDLLPPDLYNDAPFEKRHLVWCDKTQLRVQQTVKHWHQQLSLLKKLQKVVNKLSKELVPQKKINLSGPPKCQRIISTLESLFQEDGRGRRDETSFGDAGPSQKQLKDMVDHFMKLFSVKRISGVYPRMNDIYIKLGEVHNVMRTIKDILGLDDKESNNVVIDTVNQLSKFHKDTTTDQLQQLLQTDLDSLRSKLREYEEFFPVFRDIMAKLMALLEVNRLDQVVPTVQSLKILTHQ